MTIPKRGRGQEEILQELRQLRSRDANWEEGRTWSLVYHAGKEHEAFLQKVYGLFFSENALNPIAFPSLRKFESEVIRMAASLLGGDEEVCGTMTSGGSESILMAVKTYRDLARSQKQIARPKMVLPITAHPAFAKASHYFGVEAVHVPVRDDLRVDPQAVAKAIDDQTILVVGSAPQYPHGVVDPIEELAQIAREKNVYLHVDACLGGFILPFLRKLGHPVPPFDFSVEGVTSISADLHKYGYAAKGASVVLYRKPLLRRHQFFVYTDWPGGLYGSPSMAGTRPGGAIACAWATLLALGEEGYKELARKALEATKRLITGVRNIPGLRVLGEPDATVFAFASDEVNVFALADQMEKKKWHLDRQQRPDSLHLIVTAAHDGVEEAFLGDLAESVDHVRNHPDASSEGTAPMYGMMATLPDRGTVKEMIAQFMEGLYQT